MGKVIKTAATIIGGVDITSRVPSDVWIVETLFGDAKRYYYAGVSSEEEAYGMSAVKAMGEPITDIKRARNVDCVRAGEWREVPIGSVDGLQT